MNFEALIRWLGGLLAFTALGILFYGIWRGTQRQTRQTTGHTAAWLRSPIFYFAASAFFFGIAWLGWIPLSLTIAPHIRTWMLALGSLLYFPGMALLMWGRLVLGKNYFVSTGLGAQLFKGQALVTSGPYAMVRHPMYAGLMLAAWGSLLIYATWTTVYFAVFAPALLLRARHEEQALAAEFDAQWLEYCKQVPMFVPRFKR